MLEGSIVFKLSGAVQNYTLPELVVGDKNSVKLKVMWLNHETIPDFKDLTEYVVEGVYTRPDGKVSPALIFSIDQENNTIKYLVFGNWLTEIAGIANLTVRFKQNDEIKATGQITLVIQDGKQPSDVVISEPQHEALQESIQAEENARKQAILGLKNDLEQNVETINNNIDGLNNNLTERITNVSAALKEEREDRAESESNIVDDYSEKINTQKNRIDNIADAFKSLHNQVQNNSSMAQVAASKAIANEGNIEKKLSKVFNVSDANDIAEEDYFVINSGGNAYRITLAQLKEKIGNEGETVVNNYLGDFNSEAELKAAYPVAIEGNFAYVKGEDEIYAMYLWVDEDDKSGWYKSTSGKYVKTVIFDKFKEDLQNGLVTIGSIVANAELEGNEEVLQTLKVNGKNYNLPSVKFELSEEEVPSAPIAKSLNINGDAWNFGGSGGSGGVYSKAYTVEEKTFDGAINFNIDNQINDFISGLDSGTYTVLINIRLYILNFSISTHMILNKYESGTVGAHSPVTSNVVAFAGQRFILGTIFSFSFDISEPYSNSNVGFGTETFDGGDINELLNNLLYGFEICFTAVKQSN